MKLQNGNRIFVAEMKPDLSDVVPGTEKECIASTEGWENTAGACWPVAEGPTVLKHKNLYYLIYSANDFRNKDYAVDMPLPAPYRALEEIHRQPGHQPAYGRAERFRPRRCVLR